MNRFEEIKKEFGDCDWLRAVCNDWTVEAIQWMILEIERLQALELSERHTKQVSD